MQPGLVPQRPGPKRAHKLSEPVVDFLEAALAEDGSLNSTRLAQLLQDRLGLQAHPRSVERAQAPVPSSSDAPAHGRRPTGLAV